MWTQCQLGQKTTRTSDGAVWLGVVELVEWILGSHQCTTTNDPLAIVPENELGRESKMHSFLSWL